MRRKLSRASGEAGDTEGAVGFYRIGPATGAQTFEEGEIALIRTHFAARQNVFLLASQGVGTAKPFVWRNRQLQAQGRELVLSGPGALSAAPAPATGRPSSPEGPPPPATATSRTGQAIRLLGAICLASLAVALALRYLPGARTPVRTPSQDIPKASSLGLRVSTAGEDLRVSWNGESPPLKSCRLAMLSIVDGSVRREITLSPAQVAGGSVMYHRETDTVQFRLDAIGDRGAIGTEMLVAIGRAPAPVRSPVVPALPVEDIYFPPQPVSKASPVLPAGVALPATPEGVTVAVKVSIDERGWVMDARSLAPEDIEPALSDAAEQAARLWKFQPARRGERAVPSQTTLRFRFAR
jgi:TonB family protein